MLNLPDSDQPLAELDEERRRIRRLTDQQEDALVAGYIAGDTVHILAARHQITRQTVSAILERHGVKRRYNILTSDQVQRARLLYDQGQSLVDVGTELGVSSKTVLKAFRAAGVQTRPVGTNQWR